MRKGTWEPGSRGQGAREPGDKGQPGDKRQAPGARDRGYGRGDKDPVKLDMFIVVSFHENRLKV